jgi:proteasome accessory factor BC
MAGDDAKLERITDLIFALLETTSPIPLSQLAEEIPGYPEGHEARRQAFERDKRLLREEGIFVESVPIDSPEQFGYRIDPATFFLPDLALDPDEQAALNLAVAGVELGDGSGEDALKKLGIGATFDATPVASLGVVAGLDRLFQAIAAAAEVRFSYRGEARAVAPARLRFVGGKWYLAGWSKERNAGRNFRVDRIEGSISVGAPGSGVVSDEERIALVLPDGAWEADGDDNVDQLRVRVDALYAWKVASDLGDDTVVARHDDGSIEVEVDLANDVIVRSWVLSLLDHAEVIAPVEFRASVVEWLDRIVAAPRSTRPLPTLEELDERREGGDDSVRVPPAQRRVRRLLAMLEWLASVGSASTQEVADRFEMTPDEVVAELELAACCGRPPYSPAELIDIIVDRDEVSARLPEMSRPRQLTPQEGVAIAAAARTILAMPGADRNGALARALSKLEEALGRRPAIEIELTNPPFLEALQAAVGDGRRLEVDYLALSTDELSQRTIDPLRVVARGGRWYVDAYCYRAEALRTFRVDSFHDVRDVGVRAEHEVSFVDGPDVFMPSVDADVVFVHLDASALWVADSVPIVAQRLEDDGSMTIALAISGRSWFERLALQAGAGLQVLGPEGWLEVPRDAATKVLANYL